MKVNFPKMVIEPRFTSDFCTIEFYKSVHDEEYDVRLTTLKLPKWSTQLIKETIADKREEAQREIRREIREAIGSAGD